MEVQPALGAAGFGTAAAFTVVGRRLPRVRGAGARGAYLPLGAQARSLCTSLTIFIIRTSSEEKNTDFSSEPKQQQPETQGEGRGRAELGEGGASTGARCCRGLGRPPQASHSPRFLTRRRPRSSALIRPVFQSAK